MRRLTVLSIALLLAGSEAAPAQESLCYRAQPKPACSAFAFTNFGGYVVLGRELVPLQRHLRHSRATSG